MAGRPSSATPASRAGNKAARPSTAPSHRTPPPGLPQSSSVPGILLGSALSRGPVVRTESTPALLRLTQFPTPAYTERALAAVANRPTHKQAAIESASLDIGSLLVRERQSAGRSTKMPQRAPLGSLAGRARHQRLAREMSTAQRMDLDRPPRAAVRGIMRAVTNQLDRIQGSAVAVKDRLDTNPGFLNLAKKDQERLRELLDIDPHKFNQKGVEWGTRGIQEMVEDIKLAAASSAFVVAKVKAVKLVARERDLAVSTQPKRPGVQRDRETGEIIGTKRGEDIALIPPMPQHSLHVGKLREWRDGGWVT